MSAVTPTVIVALSAHHALSPAVIDSDSKQSLQESGGRRKAMRGQGLRLSLLLRQRIRKNGTKLLPIKSAVISESYCFVPCCSPASARLK